MMVKFHVLMECGNLNVHTFEDVREQVFCNGWDTNYHRWILYGEELQGNMDYSKVRKVNVEVHKDNVHVNIDENYEDMVSNNLTWCMLLIVMTLWMILMDFRFCWRRWSNLCF